MRGVDLLKKIRALREGAKTEGERKAAEEAERRVRDKYDLEDFDLETSEEVAPRTFKYRSSRERSILIQVAVSVAGKDLMGNVENRKAALWLTETQAAEVEYMYTYFKRLYREEELTLFKAFICKHDLFAKDVEVAESGTTDVAELMRIAIMMEGLQDSALRPVLMRGDYQ